MRLFVAVWPPEDVLDVLAALDRPLIAGVRWTVREQWHVTVRFLGDADAGEIVEAVRLAAASLAPTRVTLGEATARFGRSIVHVPAGGLDGWAAAVVAATAELGASRPDERPFHGHITLARSRSRAGDVRGASGIPLPPGPRSWVASELAVVHSRLGRGPAEYETVASIPAG